MNLQRIASFLLIFTTLILGITFAQLGEVAGPVSFNVNISSSQTLQMIVINSGNTTLSYNIILPTLKAQQVNSTTPTVTTPSLNGTIKPYEQMPINITVHMPSANNKPGYSWVGVVQVIETTNQANAGGAVVQSGVAKIISITAAEPKALNPLIYIAGAIVIICIVGFAYKKLLVSKRRPIIKSNVSSSSRQIARTSRATASVKKGKKAKRKGASKKLTGKRSQRKTSKKRRTR